MQVAPSAAEAPNPSLQRTAPGVPASATELKRYTASIFIGLNFFDFSRGKPSRLFQLAQLNLWIGTIGVLH